MTEFLSCELRCHEEWVPLPLARTADVSGWAEEQAGVLEARNAADGKTVNVELLMQELREQAADSRGRSPVHAFALYLNGFESAAAVLEVDFIHPDHTVREINLDWIAETFTAHDFGTPEIEHAQLPAGAAVRLSQNIAGAAEGPSGERVLLETLTYGIIPEKSDSAVVMLVSWTVPGVDDLVEKMADDIVHTLTIETDE